MNRRGFSKIVGGAALASSAQGADKEWAPSYVLSSAMYGNMPLEIVLEEVGKSGSASIDIWRKVHATHREQISKIGDEAFQNLLKKHQTKISVSTSRSLASSGWRPSARIAFCRACVGAAAWFWLCACGRAWRVHAALAGLTQEDHCVTRARQRCKIDAYLSLFMRCSKAAGQTPHVKARFSFGFFCTGPGCREPFTDAATDRGGPRRSTEVLSTLTKAG